MLEKHFDGAAFIMATARGGTKGEYSEPANDLGMRRFLAGIAGHAATFVAGMP